ncbi:DUF6966 domain-containing protein [Atopomonas sediminilitoris]|uniref:DUF6966 domain-containing protein n=1 Tax=Atopomonas sediminilitoris TaxID=2919919 RepID=UPI001F4EE612|nr:hypothetical protein [Atopomonas sediminilitoris]MCJ8169295.1 hypothetical protein [Atopomonas sediminilitoris]
MTIEVSVRIQQLEELQKALMPLCELLRLDKPTYWLAHFERCLQTTDHFLANGFDQASLNEFSISVRNVFGGMGSFNDYVPPMNTKESSAWYQKYGNPENIISLVYKNALNLMVIGVCHG